MKISIITVCYNEPELKETCESIVNQTYQDFEWIVIDGGSDQETLDVLNGYRDRIDILVSEKDKGIYNAMNKGIKLASGEYLNFLNAGDSYSDKKSLEKVSKSLNGSDIVFGNLKLIQDKKTSIKKYPDELYWGWFVNESLPHPASFIKKELFDKYGLYNEDYKIVSDWEKSIEFIEVNKCTYKHISVVVSIFNCDGISFVDSKTNLKERAEVIAKYYKGVEIEPPQKKVIGFLNIPLVKIIKKFNLTTYYLFGVLPMLKKVGKMEGRFSNAKVVCVFNNKEIFEKVVKNNDNLKSTEISGYDNTLENISITRRYNDFIEKNSDLTDCWFVFIHQDFGIMENFESVIRKLDKKFIYGAIGIKIFNGIFIGKKGQDRHIGLKRQTAVTYGEIQQGKNNFDFNVYGKRISSQKVVDSVDCCCIMIHSSLIKKYNLRFDENLKFHMYAEELCYSAKKNHRIKTKVVQMECFHLGAGALNEEFQKSVEYLKDKFKIKRIPSTCPN